MPLHQDVHETMMYEQRQANKAAALAFMYGNPPRNEDIPICDRACDDREAIEQTGYDCDCTPVDVLMGDPGLGFNVAWAMEHGDESPPC